MKLFMQKTITEIGLRCSCIAIGTLLVMLALAGCSKEETPQPDPIPFKMTIKSSTDSLTLFPVTFTADITQPAESYKWDFSDGSTVTTSTPTVQHVFNAIGNFPVRCEAKLKDKTCDGYLKINIKGDGRIIGPRHFYGIHNYDYSTPASWPTLIHTSRVITDTIIDIKAVEAVGGGPAVSFLRGAAAALKTETATEIIYQSAVFHGRDELRYYPAKDSIYLQSTDSGPMTTYISEYILMRKKL